MPIKAKDAATREKPSHCLWRQKVVPGHQRFWQPQSQLSERSSRVGCPSRWPKLFLRCLQVEGATNPRQLPSLAIRSHHRQQDGHDLVHWLDSKTLSYSGTVARPVAISHKVSLKPKHCASATLIQKTLKNEPKHSPKNRTAWRTHFWDHMHSLEKEQKKSTFTVPFLGPSGGTKNETAKSQNPQQRPTRATNKKLQLRLFKQPAYRVGTVAPLWHWPHRPRSRLSTSSCFFVGWASV